MTRYQQKVAPVASLLGLSDAELEETCLSNWHQLNYVLMHRQTAPLLARLIAIERRRARSPVDGRRARGPRSNVLLRLTRALNRAEGRARLEAL